MLRYKRQASYLICATSMPGALHSSILPSSTHAMVFRDVARVNYRAGSKEFDLYNTVVTPYIPSEPTVFRSADQQDLVSVVNEQPAIPCIDTSSLPSISLSALPDHFLQEVAIMAKNAGLGSPKALADVDPTRLFEFLQRAEGSKIPCAVFCAEIPDAEGDGMFQRPLCEQVHSRSLQNRNQSIGCFR